MRSHVTGSRAVPAGADDAPAAELNAAGWLVPKAIGAVATGPGCPALEAGSGEPKAG